MVKPSFRRGDEYNSVVVRIAAQIDVTCAISLGLAKSHQARVEICLLFHVLRLQSDVRDLFNVDNGHEEPPCLIYISLNFQQLAYSIQYTWYLDLWPCQAIVCRPGDGYDRADKEV